MSQIGSSENTFLKSSILNICCHQIVSMIAILSSHLDTTPNTIPNNKTNIRKIAMFLASGSSNQYEGAKFSYEGDFTGYLGLEDIGIYTNHDSNVMEKISQLGKNL